MSLTPSLLPRSWQVQGLVSGITVAVGYGLGVCLAWAGRHAGIPRPGALVQRWAQYVLGALALITVPVTLWFSAGWQGDGRRARRRALPVSGGAGHRGSGGAGIVGVVRLSHDAYFAMEARLLRQPLPRLAARWTAGVLVAALTVVLATGLLNQVLLRIANASSSSLNSGNVLGVARPVSPLRSGSPSSLPGDLGFPRQAGARVRGRWSDRGPDRAPHRAPCGTADQGLRRGALRPDPGRRGRPGPARTAAHRRVPPRRARHRRPDRYRLGAPAPWSTRWSACTTGTPRPPRSNIPTCRAGSPSCRSTPGQSKAGWVLFGTICRYWLRLPPGTPGWSSPAEPGRLRCQCGVLQRV